MVLVSSVGLVALPTIDRAIWGIVLVSSVGLVALPTIDRVIGAWC